MIDRPNSLEDIWDKLLSGHPEDVRAVFSSLNAEERLAVIDHLQRMASEAGWQPEQSLSAQSALQALKGVLGTSYPAPDA